MKARFTLPFLFLAICFTYGQNFSDNSLNADADTIKNFYPLETGDFWEYVGKDPRFGGSIEVLSILKEVLGDTLMPNGITYKKVMWSRAAQNPSYPSRFEYQRKDASGNVYLYYNDKDNLLYDFTKNVGDTYSSHIDGNTWKIKSKRNLSYFGAEYSTITFELISNGATIDTLIFAEEIGLVSYGYDDWQRFLPKIWGGIIGGKKYGRILAREEKIDWSAFYPLHVGDYWVYKTNSCGQGHGCNEWIDITRISKDTVMPDGNKYYIKLNLTYIMGSGIERIDTLGNVWAWDGGTAKVKFKFSSICGVPINGSSIIKSINKDRYQIGIGGNPDGQYANRFNEGLGFVSYATYNYSESLIGACINGVVWGDVSAIGVEDEPENIVADYKLEQNYPNPFNPTTNISFDLPKESFVSLTIYNILGEKIETLVNEIRRAGSHAVTFDAHNLPSGVYIYKITAGNYQASHKMLLMK